MLSQYLTQLEEITTECLSTAKERLKNSKLKLIAEQLLAAEARYNASLNVAAYKKDVYEILGMPISTPEETDESVKENIDVSNRTRLTRTQRKAFTEATESINLITTQTISTAKKKDPIKIKQERQSSVVPLVKVKIEKDDMPPPLEPVKKRRGRPKFIKPEKPESMVTPTRELSPPTSESSSGRNSDVVLNSVKVSMIELDSEDEAEMKKPIRSTRTKKKKETEKRTRSPSEEQAKPIRSTRTKRKKKEESVYQDAVNNLEKAKFSDVAVVLEKLPQELMDDILRKNQNQAIENNPNETRIIEKAAVGNETVVIEKNVNMTVIVDKKVNSTVVIEKNANLDHVGQNVSDIMTDDESVDNIQQSSKIVKPIFNLFENSPVKKRVEAFEKLGQAAVDAPPRMTRTKNKKKKASMDAEAQAAPKASQIPVKSSEVTPLQTNRYLPSMTSLSTTKVNRHGSIESLIPAKSLSAIKASQKEYREREQRRREKEAEAAKKKDALMQAQIEEKRRKREEKEMKAKLQREELEREKLRVYELQKQLHREKHEKVMKQREEAERKRQLMKQKAEEKKEEEERRKKLEDEIKKKEEERRKRLEEKAKQKKIEEYKKKKPIYMSQPAPLLPSHDCYDSDDEQASKNTAEKPLWAKRKELPDSLTVMENIDDKLKNTFFYLKPQTPDLREIFENIDPQMLRRNSSAIWNNAPRFTLMPDYQDNV